MNSFTNQLEAVHKFMVVPLRLLPKLEVNYNFFAKSFLSLYCNCVLMDYDPEYLPCSLNKRLRSKSKLTTRKSSTSRDIGAQA